MSDANKTVENNELPPRKYQPKDVTPNHPMAYGGNFKERKQDDE